MLQKIKFTRFANAMLKQRAAAVQGTIQICFIKNFDGLFGTKGKSTCD